LHLTHVAVLDRIEVDVVDVALKITLVAQRVLPVASLPDPTLAPGGTAFRNGLSGRQSRENADLISRHRSAKSQSFSCSDQMVWRWSGNTTMASIVNGCRFRV